MIKQLLDSFHPENHLILWLIFSFVLALIISAVTLPTILYVSEEKQLMAEPEERSSHTTKVPNLGGVGIFFGLIVVMTITGAFLDTKLLLLLMGTVSILFFLGLKDDLTVLSAKKKFIVQFFVALLAVVITDTRIVSFSGIFGVNEIPYWLSIVFTLFVYILIVNAYNLIDGVDGLAGVIAIASSTVFAYLFIKSNNYSLATISVALIGAILPFLRLNFSKDNKMFMGDTGSMIVGFLLAFFAVSFITVCQKNSLSVYNKSAPILSLAILFYPLVDTMRIFLLRIFLYKTSPFTADKNHIHHRCIEVGFSHKSTTFLIVFINILIVILSFNCLNLSVNYQLLALLGYGLFLYLIPYVFLKKLGLGKEIINNTSIKSKSHQVLKD